MKFISYIISLISNPLGLYRFTHDLFSFLRAGGKVNKIFPIVYDYSAASGVSSGHYFHQDLLVASLIYECRPDIHVDVGSRVDGFVAHVASFMPICVYDIRESRPSIHKNIRYVKHDFSVDNNAASACYMSVSSLHAIEHFGLGRYGDTIDPIGMVKGFANISALVDMGGRLYISYPISNRAYVAFNAHRVVEPDYIFHLINSSNNHFELERFDYVDDNGDLVCQASVYDVAELKYGCGIYTLKRTS